MNNNLFHNELSDDQMGDVMGGNPAHGAAEETRRKLEEIKKSLDSRQELEEIKKSLDSRQATKDSIYGESALKPDELTEAEMSEVKAGVPRR